MNSDDLYQKLRYLCENQFTVVSSEKMNEVTGLTRQKIIYSDWPFYYMGDDFVLYTGFDINGEIQRYFLYHLNSDWWGGWTYNQQTIWYEITKLDYDKLYTQQ